jgi:hypothetical protein
MCFVVLRTARIYPELDVLGRMAAFVLNRASDDCRSELHEYLVMLALYEDKVSKGLDKEQIVSSIEKDLGVSEFPVQLVVSAIDSLQNKGLIKRVRAKERDLYFLAQDEKTRIQMIEEQYSRTIGQVKTSITHKMKEKGTVLDMGQEVLVFVTFRNFLAVVLTEMGTECCFTLIGSHGKSMNNLRPVNVIEVLEKTLGTVGDAALRRTMKEVIMEYIATPDTALSDFVYSLGQSYFMIQMLNLDPECQALTKERLKRKRVYLDTNTIHHSITGNDKRNKAVDDALKLTSALGITSVISKKTKEEFLVLVRTRRNAFGREPTVPKERFEKTSNELEDGFLKDFLVKKSGNPNLTFDRYADRLDEIDTILKNRYGTVSDSEDYKEIYENPDFPKLSDIVVREGVNFGLFKTKQVADHDAFHILLVQELRKKEEGDILGPNYWFLTHDRSLAFVEKKFGNHGRIPSSIFVDNWVQLISPLLSPKQTQDARDAYMSLFASRLPILAGAIDDEDLSPKDISRVIGNRYVKDYYKLSQEQEKSIPEKDKQNIVEAIVAEVKTQRREASWMRKSIKELEKTTKELRTEVGTWKQLSDRQKSILSRLGHVVGGAVFLLLWIGLYEFFVRFHSVEHWAAFFASMILAASVGAIADLFGYRWLLDRLLRHTGSESQKHEEVTS